MIAAKNYEAGAFCVRQVEFALFDMLLHSAFDPKTDSVQALLDSVRREVAVVFPPAWNRFPQSFSHIFAGGYGAGYYSYKWAEVLSADCFSAFEEEGVLNPDTGRRYLKEILERGSSRDAIDNFVAFRGRKPELDPCFVSRASSSLKSIKHASLPPNSIRNWARHLAAAASALPPCLVRSRNESALQTAKSRRTL